MQASFFSFVLLANVETEFAISHAVSCRFCCTTLADSIRLVILLAPHPCWLGSASHLGHQLLLHCSHLRNNQRNACDALHSRARKQRIEPAYDTHLLRILHLAHHHHLLLHLQLHQLLHLGRIHWRDLLGCRDIFGFCWFRLIVKVSRFTARLCYNMHKACENTHGRRLERNQQYKVYRSAEHASLNSNERR